MTNGRIMGAGKPHGPKLIADYVLVYKNHKLAVVEAKAWDEELTRRRGAGEEYAGKLEVRFAYASNGQGVYPIDMETAVEGPGGALVFPTPEELWAGRFAGRQNAWRERFAAIPFPDKSETWALRFYQEIAVNRVLEAMADGEDRALLTLATGTGKTSIAFQIAWKLFAARWNLIDWKPGRAAAPAAHPVSRRPEQPGQSGVQRLHRFAAFNEDDLVRIAPDAIRKKGKVPKNGQVFFTIFQTFMSGPPKLGKDGKMHPSPYFGEYEPDFFDFIVIDECHRGGANDESTWRDILEYFKPAVQLGLTATPKRKDNVDTYAYFGEPVYIYSLKEGINDGFLTPFRVKQISTTLDEYMYTSDDQVVEGEVEVGQDDTKRRISTRSSRSKSVSGSA